MKYIKFKSLQWSSHIDGIDNSRRTNKDLLEGKFHGSRAVRRQRLRWEDNMQVGLAAAEQSKIMKASSRGQEYLEESS